MHHLPYTYVLHSGKSIIQHVYDSHYAAAEEAQQFPVRWRALEGSIDPDRFSAVLNRLEYQAGHAIGWRDAICSWFLHESGISDALGRAGHFPGRTEAESMQLTGYTVNDVTPWEDASGGKAVVCEAPQQKCSASFTLLCVFLGGCFRLRAHTLRQRRQILLQLPVTVRNLLLAEIIGIQPFRHARQIRRPTAELAHRFRVAPGRHRHIVALMVPGLPVETCFAGIAHINARHIALHHLQSRIIRADPARQFFALLTVHPALLQSFKSR